MNVLFIGGTGEISYECLKASVEVGHRCAVFNRGRGTDTLPEGVAQFTGDLASDSDYRQLASERFDIVCQFKAYTPADVRRDLEILGGRCSQYIFVSTASAYKKPPDSWRITEETPLGNRFWSYSQLKADAECLVRQLHDAGRLPATIVRPSLTYRRNFPGTFVSGDDHAWRMLNDRPVIIHGDGQTVWTYTHARDFARLFVPLLGNSKALGEAFHIMTDTAYTWDFLFHAVAKALDIQPRFVHVPTQTLVRYNADWTGPLLGDKAWSSVFDTAKIRAISGAVNDPMPLETGYAAVYKHFSARMEHYKPEAVLHSLLDRIAGDQESLGTR